MGWGHGPYKKYLMKFHISDTEVWEDCGEIDDPFHSILFCPAQEDIRAALHDKAIEAGELPWNIATMLMYGTTFRALKNVHTQLTLRLQVWNSNKTIWTAIHTSCPESHTVGNRAEPGWSRPVKHGLCRGDEGAIVGFPQPTILITVRKPWLGRVRGGSGFRFSHIDQKLDR